MLNDIPVEVRSYLSAGDGLGKVAVQQRYPDLQRTLNAPETRAALLRYLASDQPWQEPAPGFLMNILSFLQSKASQTEVPIVEKYLGYPNPWVRVRAADYMMGVYYPARNRAGLIQLFERMLIDEDEVVRMHAARSITGMKATAEMRAFLEGWLQTARRRKWDSTESFTAIQQAVR